MQLRPYQQRAIERLRDAIRGGSRCTMLYSPTGSGKTEMAIEVIMGAVAKGKRVMFTVNRVPLVDQASHRLSASGLEHGIIQADNTARTYMGTIVASIQTLHARGAPDADLIVIDEAHAVAGSEAYRALIANTTCPIIGLSATPFSKGLGLYFNSMVTAATIRELIEQGYLVDVDIYAPSAPDLAKVRTTGGDYNLKDLGVAVNKAPLIGDIVQTWERLGEGKATVCFATDVAHSEAIVARFNAAGIPAEHIDYRTEDEDRRAILNRLTGGFTKVVSNVAVLAEGWDCPVVENMILARPTKSLTRYIQMAGRVLRPFDGKHRARMLDHSGTAERLGFPTDDLPLELDMGKPREKSKSEAQPRLPTPCPKCHYLKAPGVHECPACGFKPERVNQVTHAKGTLVKVDRDHITREEKARVYAMLLGYAFKHGYKDGWAYHKLREFCGRYPDGEKPVPIEPDAKLLSWIKSRNIAHAKAKAKAEQQPTPGGAA